MAYLRNNPDGTTSTKVGISSIYPKHVIESYPGITRIEPILTPQKLKKRYLFGVSLYSPVTGEKISLNDLKDYILRAISITELELKTSILPDIKRFKLPFDPNMYRNNVYLEIPAKPIQQVIKLSIASANYTFTSPENMAQQYPSPAEIYTLPAEWIDMSNALYGRLNILPLSPTFAAASATTAISSSGAILLQTIGRMNWLPSYWLIEVLVGLGTTDGQVPVIINEIIGYQATILLLDQLIPQFRIVSQSLNIDGHGQFVNDQSYALLQDKREQAKMKYSALLEQMKGIFNLKIFSTHI